MPTPHSSFLQLLPLFIPEELLEHFVLKNITEIPEKDPKTDWPVLKLELEEKNTPPVVPEEHRGKRITSKGFHRPLTIQDFPVRDHLCMFVLHRRRWEIEGTGTLERQLSVVPGEGIKLTATFAAFLKEADRTRAGGSRTHRETLWRGET